MKRGLHALSMLLVEALSARRDAQVRFLKAQLQIARRKIPGNRVILDPAERLRLLALGEELRHEVQDILELVSLKTYRRWIRE